MNSNAHSPELGPRVFARTKTVVELWAAMRLLRSCSTAARWVFARTRVTLHSPWLGGAEVPAVSSQRPTMCHKCGVGSE